MRKHTKKSFKKHALTLLIPLLAGSAGVAIVMPSAYAQPGAASEAQAIKQYQIPAGELGVVLGQFAGAAGVALSFDTAITTGKQSPGLRGAYTVDQAFLQLLKGHSLELIRSNNGVYALREIGDEQVMLPAVNVNAEGLGMRSEGNGSYTVGNVRVFNKDQTLREVPHSLTVFSRERLNDQKITNLESLVEVTPGLSINYTDSERISFYSRGHQIDAIQYDGASVASGAGGGSFIQPDMAIFDRVEVIRGTTGLMQGAGNPSGTINLVRKRPTKEFQMSGSGAIGTWDNYRLEGDISGSLTDSGNVRGRLVMAWQDKEMFQVGRSDARDTIYGVVETDLTEKTLLTGSLQYSYQDTTGSWGGLPALADGSPIDLPRETYLGSYDNRWDRSNIQGFVELQHTFANDWTVKASVTETRLETDRNGFQQTYFVKDLTDPNPYIYDVQKSLYRGSGSDQTHVGLTAEGSFNLFGRTHELSAGAEWWENLDKGSYGDFDVFVWGTDIRNWNPYSSMPEWSLTPEGTSRETTKEQSGLWASSKWSVADPLHVILGARVSNWKTSIKGNSTPSSNYKIENEVTPYAAVVYDFHKNLSAFVSYTEIFKDQYGLDINGKLLDPIRGESYEVGVKGEYFDSRLTSNVALFRIDNVGKSMEDIESPNPCMPWYTSAHCRVASGKTRSEGVDMDISGEILPGVELTAGYTYTKTKFITDTISNIGSPLRSIDPEHQVKLYANWRLPDDWSAWTIGGGLNGQSDTYSSSGGIRAEQGGYTTFSALVKYRANDKLTIQLNANNLFDKVYYKKIGPSGLAYYYGDPRNVLLTLRATY